MEGRERGGGIGQRVTMMGTHELPNLGNLTLLLLVWNYSRNKCEIIMS
jgi:hypothetical protein